jgi:hypothetical protein
MEKKNQVAFNHNAESLSEALGVDRHMYAAQLAAILTLLATDGMDKVSRASEMMHKCVDYNILLLLATNHLINIASEFGRDHIINLSEN